MTDKIAEWRSTVMICAGAVQTLGLLPLAELIQAGQRAQSVGAILDPTMWRDKNVALDQDLELLKAAQTFVSTMRAAMERAQRRGEMKVAAE